MGNSQYSDPTSLEDMEEEVEEIIPEKEDDSNED